MARHRWWQAPELSIEKEQSRFAAAGLAWELDQALFDSGEIVVFNGQLRRGEERVAAKVVYPPSYDAGEQPVVVAPELDIGRHRAPNGALCLDHRVLGQVRAMSGAEAVLRAERLWEMWHGDYEELYEEEADAPDPWSNYVDYTLESAVLHDLPEGLGDQGYFEVALQSLVPFRGSLVGFRETHPEHRHLEVSGVADALSGDFRVQGRWKRLQQHPPAPHPFALNQWLAEEQQVLLRGALNYATGHEDPQMPALLGFVFPDEGPGRGETHDAWLFVVIRPNGSLEFPRPFSLRGEETWLRQPQLSPLAGRSVAIVGAGALGSQIAALLARAGVGRFVLVDFDYVSSANRVRHELDLADIGRSKTLALADRLHRVNPWAEVRSRDHRFGHFGASFLGAIQGVDDQVAAEILGTDLVINASAEVSTGYHCAAHARSAGRPVLHAWVGPGAWGARILLQRGDPEPSGCTECLARWQRDIEEGTEVDVEVPALAADPNPKDVIDRGCADPTFTGPGFELTAAAGAAARIATQLLLEGASEAYPAPEFDLATLSFRNVDSARPDSHYSRLPVHAECMICNA